MKLDVPVKNTEYQADGTDARYHAGRHAGGKDI